MTEDDDPPPQPSIPIPDDIDDWDPREAYVTGAAIMADNVINAMHTLRPEIEAESDPDEEGVCRVCGTPTHASMGGGDTEFSPEGYKCPACEL